MPAAPQAPSFWSSLWRRGGLVYLATLLAATAAGLWSRTIYPPLDEFPAAPLPALRILLAGQAVFIFVIYPLIWLWRGQRRRPWRFAHVAGELAMLTFVGLPFVLCAAYVSDAVATDGVRCLIYAALLWPFGWAASLWITRPGAAAAVMILGLLATGGAAAWFYCLREFLPAIEPNWAWHGGVITNAWHVAASRVGTWWPTPTWAGLLWPVVGVAGLLVALLHRPRATGKAPEGATQRD